MSTDPIEPAGAERVDPTSLPLFTRQPPAAPNAPAPRPGRVRGTFTMHPPPTPVAPSPSAVPVRLDQARRRHHPTPAPTPTTLPLPVTSPAGPGGEGPVDWGLVTAFRTVVAQRLVQAGLPDRAGQEAFGREVIAELLAEHTADAVATGEPAWGPGQRTVVGQAVFDAVFRLGRLQPLVDDDRVENIVILGADRVLLELVDGTRLPGPPVADSDEELVDFLRFLANRSESNPRPFSQGTPRLHMKLDGGARLAATAWVVSRPTVVIRRHRLQVDTLEAWVDRGCLSPAAGSFLAAAVRAAWSIVVSGPMSAGKTTLVRALCGQIPRDEAIGTFETEYELFLAETGRHDVVIDWEARPGVGEIGPDGRPAGAFDLADALLDSFRFSLSRQIVGEVRGPEAWTMIKAMESGTGSLSTTHAADAATCLRKLVTCAMEAGPHVTRDLALEKLAGSMDLIVQVSRRIDPTPGGGQVLRRWVSEIVLVEPGEKETGYALTHLFGPDRDGPAHATGLLPARCADLAEHGFDLDTYHAETDQHRGWPT